MHITGILADAYRFFSGNFRQLTVLFLPIMTIVTLLGLVPEMAGNEEITTVFWQALIYFLLYPFYAGAMILFLAKSTRHETTGYGQLLRESSALWWPLLMLTLIVGIAVLFGFALLILPGIWIAIRLSFAEIYLVVEGLSPLAALRKSHEATREVFWLILAIVVILNVPLIGLSILLDFLVDASGGGSVLKIITESIVAFLGLFVNVAVFRIYLLQKLEQAQE